METPFGKREKILGGAATHSALAAGFFTDVRSFPLETVVDATGAGDSYAGGFFGYLDWQAGGEQDDVVLRAAAVYGSVMASFHIESFGASRGLLSGAARSSVGSGSSGR